MYLVFSLFVSSDLLTLIVNISSAILTLISSLLTPGNSTSISKLLVVSFISSFIILLLGIISEKKLLKSNILLLCFLFVIKLSIYITSFYINYYVYLSSPYLYF